MSRRRKSRPTKRQQRERNKLISGLFILGTGILLFYSLYTIARPFFFFILTVVAVVAIFLIYRQVRKAIKRQKLKGELENHLLVALEAMDTTGKTYADEAEANKELVTVLKSQGHTAIYEFRLSDGRTADAKVDNVLIEGKLAPGTDDVDRLLGQLQSYCQHPYKVNIVIYGYTKKELLKRIENEILERYQGKVFLTYLNNPKRRRA